MKTILLLEDDEIFAFSAATQLRADGYRVFVHSSVVTALDLLDSDQVIDFILADLSLGDGKPNGLTFLQMAEMRRRSTPKALITAYRDLLGDGSGLLAPVFYKPIDITELSQAIWGMLANSRENETPSVEPSILVVDDDRDIREFNCELLIEFGFTVVAAANGPEAIDRFEEFAFDAVLTDVQMPGAINGFDLARIIKTRHPETLVTCTSGFHQLSAQVPYYDHFLQKPYTAAQLRTVLERLLPR